MKLRLATMRDVPLFDHEGMVLREQWSMVDTADLSAAGRAAIPKYRGHILQVHPEDVGTFDELVASLPTTEAHVDTDGAPGGPTIEQWVGHGYKAESYPGMGYAAVESPALATYRRTGKVPKAAVEKAMTEEREREAAQRSE